MVFVGVHPLLMHVPPRKVFSISATCHPMSARRNEGRRPACPEPITRASYFIHEVLNFLQSFNGEVTSCETVVPAYVAPAFRRAPARIYSVGLKADATKTHSRIDCHMLDSGGTQAATRSPTTGP